MEDNQEYNRAAQAIQIAALIHKWREKEPLTEQEQSHLDEWRAKEDHEQLFQQLADRKQFISALHKLKDYDSGAAVNSIFTRLGLRPPRQAQRIRMQKRWIPAAAAALVLSVAATWMLQKRNSSPRSAVSAPVPEKDIAPGSNKATLTLADGTQITLDSSRTGTIARQGAADIKKLDSGRLVYQQIGKAPTAANNTPKVVADNTLSTPRGGQYRLSLPDGTQVWLNAASSITYPVAFTGPDRSVKITGEAYFEVAHDSRHPFRVKAGEQTIEDIGTAFNVNAYVDEPAVSTTLVEGGIKVSAGRSSRTLSPGQQVQTHPGQLEIVDHPDIDGVLAWKNGTFAFRDADLSAVMRQLSRWYDIEVQYEGPVPPGKFDGEIGRGLTLTQVLQGLARTHINYTIVDDHKIIIRP